MLNFDRFPEVVNLCVKLFIEIVLEFNQCTINLCLQYLFSECNLFSFWKAVNVSQFSGKFIGLFIFCSFVCLSLGFLLCFSNPFFFSFCSSFSFFDSSSFCFHFSIILSLSISCSSCCISRSLLSGSSCIEDELNLCCPFIHLILLNCQICF